MGLVFISHDLELVASFCDRVLVMYAGRVVEEGEVRTIFRGARHPYTRGLLGSIPGAPGARGKDGLLRTIAGTVPSLKDLPEGCAFAPRCSYAVERCRAEAPPLAAFAPGHVVACFESARVTS
jgi:oligopeptide/dipeptide ABC transporter ATP-binding protein